MVGDVQYYYQTLVLGSTKGQPSISQTIIRVIFDNKDNQYSRVDLIELKNQIIKRLMVFLVWIPRSMDPSGIGTLDRLLLLVWTPL